MTLNKREIYVKLDQVSEIVQLLSRIKQQEDEVKQRFAEFERLNNEETKLVGTWSDELEKITQRLDHLTL